MCVYMLVTKYMLHQRWWGYYTVCMQYKCFNVRCTCCYTSFQHYTLKIMTRLLVVMVLFGTPWIPFFGSIETLAFLCVTMPMDVSFSGASITVIMTLYSTLTCWGCGCFQISCTFTCCSWKCWFAKIYKSHKHILLVTFWTYTFEERGQCATSHLGRGSLQ